MATRRARAWRLGSHAVGLAPLAAAALAARSHGLGANPVETATLWTGRSAIAMLLLTLACTPVSSLLGWRQAVAARRTLGLYAFLYATLHFLVFVGVDYGFDLSLIRDDGLAEKPFIVVGALSGAILMVLAATSSKASKRKLGRNWKRLHRLVYLAGVLASVHFLWKVKALTIGPVLVAIVLTSLLLVRVPPVRRVLSRARVGGSGPLGPTSAP